MRQTSIDGKLAKPHYFFSGTFCIGKRDNVESISDTKQIIPTEKRRNLRKNVQGEHLRKVKIREYKVKTKAKTKQTKSAYNKIMPKKL